MQIPTTASLAASLAESLAAACAVLATSGCTAPGTSDPVTETQPDYVAQFNEPFYSFSSDGEQLTVRSPLEPDGKTIATNRSEQVAVTRFGWSANGAAFLLEVERGECFDDMSGLRFSHIARYSGGAYESLPGCARLASEPQPREK